MLLRNDNEQEIISREGKDRRDFEQLAKLANQMCLHRYFIAPMVSRYCTRLLLLSDNILHDVSRQYSRIVVFSKDPLPNYRSDLDDKRPQREVC
jgi:ATP-dependent RNA helicase DHX36